ncbi:hypothetical protein [Flaviaesturariibacter amylovorans]|uniref:Lipocalin-like domain-containing protein n=1 Tax=Flaviaesturariibacter amylovorans TaxID=1084520 RepID=A0ABP8GEG5_9BACT
MRILLPFLCAFLLLLAPSCKKSNDDNDNLINVGAFLQGGDWRVTKFVDSGQDETSNFSGYSFTFAASGTVTATNGANTVTGNWGSTVSDDRSKVLIVFTSPATFQELSEDWEVLESGTQRISLRHVSGGNGSTDELVLERN